jgi:hypothetical protein
MPPFSVSALYTGVVSDAELAKITVDYNIEFVRALHESRPRRFVCPSPGWSCGLSNEAAVIHLVRPLHVGS